MTLIELIADNYNIHPKHINKDKILNNIEDGTLDLWLECARVYGIGEMEIHVYEGYKGELCCILSVDDRALDAAKAFEYKFIGKYRYELKNKEQIIDSDNYNYIATFKKYR